MLRSVKDLEGFAIGATDGAIGHVRDLYLDDAWWIVRYLVVDTGTWLRGRRVLISPIAVVDPGWKASMFAVSITREQVRASPDVDTDMPVSRQHELQHLDHYGYPNYWSGGGPWGAGMYPNALLPGYEGFGSSQAARADAEIAYARAEAARHRNNDPHLRSCNAMTGYQVHAPDGDIGHVRDVLVDDETWAVRYFVVDTGHWWLGHNVLIAPQWIDKVSWRDTKVYVRMTRQAVKDSPAYGSAAELDRNQELGIYRHYAQPVYWAERVRRETGAPRP